MAYKCDQCDREFNTEQGLAQHKTDKHGVTSHDKREMKKEQTAQIRQDESSKMKAKGRDRLILIGLGAIVLIGIAYVLLNYLNSPVVYANGSNNTLGDPNAPVTLTEYSDYECPFCARFATQTEPLIIADYVNSSKVKIVYKHFPLTQAHTYAEKAAEASECAANQGKFWQYHDVLFENNEALYLTALKKYAADLGLDTNAFNQCLDSGSMADRIRADTAAGTQVGVESTPTFFVGSTKISGAQPYSVFQSAIDAELNKNASA